MEDSGVLIREFAVSLDLIGAMDAAGYSGRGRFKRAARDIEERADELRELIRRGDCLDRILAEYERIAFSDDDEKIRIADKLKALEMYRVLSCGGVPNGGGGLVVNYDYGE